MGGIRSHNRNATVQGLLDDLRDFTDRNRTGIRKIDSLTQATQPDVRTLVEEGGFTEGEFVQAAARISHITALEARFSDSTDQMVAVQLPLGEKTQTIEMSVTAGAKILAADYQISQLSQKTQLTLEEKHALTKARRQRSYWLSKTGVAHGNKDTKQVRTDMVVSALRTHGLVPHLAEQVRLKDNLISIIAGRYDEKTQTVILPNHDMTRRIVRQIQRGIENPYAQRYSSVFAGDFYQEGPLAKGKGLQTLTRRNQPDTDPNSGMSMNDIQDDIMDARVREAALRNGLEDPRVMNPEDLMAGSEIDDKLEKLSNYRKKEWNRRFDTRYLDPRTKLIAEQIRAIWEAQASTAILLQTGKSRTEFTGFALQCGVGHTEWIPFENFMKLLGVARKDRVTSEFQFTPRKGITKKNTRESVFQIGDTVFSPSTNLLTLARAFAQLSINGVSIKPDTEIEISTDPNLR